jgi:3-phenylpropionate/cinnamic acid dioxygenase small subunit
MGGETRDIADRIAIDDLLTAYAVAVDDRDWDAVRACFAPGAKLDYTTFGAPDGPVDEVVEWIAKMIAPFEMTQHHITNRKVTLDGDSATVVSYLFNPMTAGGSLIQVGGRYHDKLQRTPDGWRISERRAEYRWSNPPIPRS